jgi:hypothetical protein
MAGVSTSRSRASSMCRAPISTRCARSSPHSIRAEPASHRRSRPRDPGSRPLTTIRCPAPGQQALQSGLSSRYHHPGRCAVASLPDILLTPGRAGIRKRIINSLILRINIRIGHSRTIRHGTWKWAVRPPADCVTAPALVAFGMLLARSKSQRVSRCVCWLSKTMPSKDASSSRC